MAVKSVLKVINPATATNVDLKDIRVVTVLGGTVDDTEVYIFCDFVCLFSKKKLNISLLFSFGEYIAC